MAGKQFLIPASLLLEQDTDSFQALVRQAKAGNAGRVSLPKVLDPDKTRKTDVEKKPSSDKSAALSKLVKKFKPPSGEKKDQKSQSELPGLPPEKSKKPDSGLAKAVGALDEPGKSKPSDAPAGADKPAGAFAGTGAGKRSAMAQAPRPSIVDKVKGMEPDVEHPPGMWDSFDHDEPSLHQRVRPDIVPHDERHDDFHQRYHAQGAKLEKFKYKASSSSHVFDGTMDDGTRFISKPHEHPWGEGAHGAEPKEWDRRHNAVARILNHMGAGHMIQPATTAKMHDSDSLPGDHPSIDDHGQRSGHYHAGKDTFITEFAPNTVNGHEGYALAHKVDGEHRLMGALTHLLTFNSDGHGGNVMINQEHGHPVLIDHDLSMSLGAKRGEIRSQFAPGQNYDYQAKLGKVGTNFPPRAKKTLEWLAKGGHYHPEGGLDLHDDDREVIKGMAKLLLTKGMEGTIDHLKGAGFRIRG